MPKTKLNVFFGRYVRREEFIKEKNKYANGYSNFNRIELIDAIWSKISKRINCRIADKAIELDTFY